MENKDYIKSLHDDAERRYFTLKTAEIRMSGGGEDEPAVIEGIAAVVDRATDIGPWEEMILPGAFDDVLGDDVAALFNHDPNQILARTTSGTLELFISKEGNLGYRFTTPNRSYATDLQDAIASGDVSQSSFAFRIKEVQWEFREPDEKDLRKIVKLDRLYDVSPVTYAAYPDTSVGKRGLAEARKELEPDEVDNGKYRRRLTLMSHNL